MAKDVKFNIKLEIDGKEQIVTASTNVKQFAEELEIARTESTKLRDDLLKITQVGASFQNVITGLQQLTSVMRTYTAAKAAQIEAETKLANNMRNTMGARDADIQSIKDLCAAQQQLGVIGDEIQLAGAQELTTYLEKKESLEKLIPVMNDMLAQQYGLNATQENAANIATMLGKVMDGQVGALSRYGYKFDEVQEQILKFGTEGQRAAVLAEVVESAVGGMNEALAKTDAGKAKQAADAIGDMEEQVGALFATIEPTIIAVGELGMAFMAIGTTYNGIKGVYVGMVGLSAAVKKSTIITYAQATASKVAAAAQFLWSKQLYYGRQASIAWAFGAKLATVQAMAMRAAIMGLMAVTGVGLAIMAVSSVVSLFANKTDEAADSMKNATREMRNVEEESKRLEDIEQAAASAYTNASATLEIYKEKLKNLIAAKNTGKDTSNEEKKIVEQLNDTYGETMGYFGSVAKWYDALVLNSEAYCRQMVLEAKTRQLANQIAEKEAETHNILYDDKGNKRNYSRQNETRTEYTYVDTNPMTGIAVYSSRKVEIPGTSDWDKANQKVRDNQDVIADLQQQMRDVVAEAGQIDFKVKGSATRPTEDKTNKKGKKDLKLIADAKTYEDLTNNVSYYQQELEKANIADTEHILTLARAKKAAEDAVTEFKDLTETVNVPIELKSLDDYDKKLRSLRKQKQTANKEAIAGIDAEIERIEAARQALEDESVAALKDDEIKTYDQLNKKLAYYNRLLEIGDAKQRVFAQNGINELKKLSEAWDLALEETKLPATTGTLEDLDAAIAFYTKRQQREDADQIQKTQLLINKLKDKKAVLQLGIELPDMQKEVADIEALTGKEHLLKIKAIGLDELTDRIKELTDILNDAQNPVTDNQRKEIEGLIATYEKWKKESVSTFDTVRSAWGGIESIGNGIQSLTGVLEGDGNAWQKITAVIGGFMQIFDGMQTVINLIGLLTPVTNAFTAAATASSAAQMVGIAAQQETIAATIPEIVLNEQLTASYLELASAKFFAAHASIPFAGVAFAEGFTATAVATVQSIKAMPFAKGGVVSGPTLAIIGEYAGASNNPEVVAPLDRLRSLIDETGSGGGRVEFVIKGRTLAGILEKENRVKTRS